MNTIEITRRILAERERIWKDAALCVMAQIVTADAMKQDKNLLERALKTIERHAMEDGVRFTA